MWQWINEFMRFLIILGFAVTIYFIVGTTLYIKYFVIRKEISTDFQEKYDGSPSKYTRFVCAFESIATWWYWRLWLYIANDRKLVTDCTTKPACVNCINQRKTTCPH
jgi:hypothetical protein